MVQEASVIPGVYWSHGDRRAISVAPAFCAHCSGAMVDWADRLSAQDHVFGPPAAYDMNSHVRD